MCIDFMMAQNKTSGSPFYGKVNLDKIGIGGHSQGGVGAVNSAAAQSNGHRIVQDIAILGTYGPSK